MTNDRRTAFRNAFQNLGTVTTFTATTASPTKTKAWPCNTTLRHCPSHANGAPAWAVPPNTLLATPTSTADSPKPAWKAAANTATSPKPIGAWGRAWTVPKPTKDRAVTKHAKTGAYGTSDSWVKLQPKRGSGRLKCKTVNSSVHFWVIWSAAAPATTGG